MERSRRRVNHEPPDWLREEPDYFITLCGNPRGRNHFCNTLIGPVVLDSIKHRNEKEIWFCHIAVLMPDHIHMIVSFPDLASFVQVVTNWKHWLSRQHGVHWQENFFEHRIRKDDSSDFKPDYILQNPVRAGLVQKVDDWPYLWMA